MSSRSIHVFSGRSLSSRSLLGAATVALLAVAAVGCSSDAGGGSNSTTSTADAAGSTEGSDVDSGDLRQSVVTALTNDVMVPGYQDMADDAASMRTAIEALCATPADAALLSSAQESWSAARTSWLLTRAFRFGPATTLRTMSTIDFPIDTSKIDKLVAGTEPLTEPLTEDSIAALGSDQRGLGGIEHVLFNPDPLSTQSCSYLVAASRLVADASDAVLDGWTVGIDGEQPFAEQLTNPGQGGMYATEHEALEDLINSMIFATADVADARIGRASGDVTGTPVPEEIDAGLARRAKQDALDVVAGIQTVFAGASLDGTAGVGIGDIVAAISASTVTTMDDQLAAALTTLEMLNDPLADATDPAPAHAAYEALKAVQVTLRAEIASQLGVTLTFGDADGDS